MQPSYFLPLDDLDGIAHFVASRMTEPGHVRLVRDGADFLVSVFLDVEYSDPQHHSSANKMLWAIEQGGMNATQLVATRLATRAAEGVVGGALTGLGLSSKARADAATLITVLAAALGGIAGRLMQKELHLFEWRRSHDGRWYDIPPGQPGTQPVWAY